MSETKQREILISRRRKQRTERLRRWWPVVVLVLLVVASLFYLVQPPPQQRLVIATGSSGGMYYAHGMRYKAALQAQGVDVKVLRTAGSIENLKLLRAGKADVAFVQSGTSGAGDDELRSLTSLYFEPIWVFHRKDVPIKHLRELLGKRVAIGAEGSGARPLAKTLLEINGLKEGTFKPMPLSGTRAADALVRGDVDAAFFVTSPNSAYIKQLLRDPSVRALPFSRSEAYQARYRFLSSVTIHEGMVDLGENLPDHDVRTVAASANLVGRSSLHPALAAQLLMAARKLHHKGGLLEEPEQFPTAKYVELPLSEDAQRYFEHGPPLLQRYLPFPLAVLIDRLKLMLLPLLTLMIPLARLGAPLYRWRMRSRIYLWYELLREMDQDVAHDAPIERLEGSLRVLDRMEAEVAEIDVPLSYMEEFYHLRLHIVYIENRVVEALTRRRAVEAGVTPEEASEQARPRHFATHRNERVSADLAASSPGKSPEGAGEEAAATGDDARDEDASTSPSKPAPEPTTSKPEDAPVAVDDRGGAEQEDEAAQKDGDAQKDEAAPEEDSAAEDEALTTAERARSSKGRGRRQRGQKKQRGKRRRR